MIIVVVGGFFFLHGLVHLLYAGQSGRVFELRPGMIWPDGSWVLSRLLDDERTRWIAVISLALAALGFMAAGLGLIFQQNYWRPMVVGSAVFSTAIFLLFWDGKFQALDNKGLLGMLINLAILIIVLVLK